MDDLRDEKCWQEFRDQMPVTRHWVYLDHASVAPLLRPVADAMHAWVRNVSDQGAGDWALWRRKVESARRAAAEMLGANATDLALIRNTTEGVNIVAGGFPWQPGDNVITFADEFPSNVFAWKALADQGVEVRQIPTRDERFELQHLCDACDRHTRIVAVSWVGYATGWRNDLNRIAEIAHHHDALVFVDAIQGLGVLPLNVTECSIDFLAADGHKWLLGPEGAGLFYARPTALERIRPSGLGWNSVVQAGDFSDSRLDLKPGSARFEGGSYNMAGVAGLEASLNYLNGIGVDAVQRRLRGVVEKVHEILERAGCIVTSARSPGRWSGIVAFQVPGRDPHEVCRDFREAGLLLNCRGGRVRLSPHVYTNADDLRALQERLQHLMGD
ncbi:MAG: aminotransferase class V-fold PLP-dependent enzyme [Planctomycetaceae bacterium]